MINEDIINKPIIRIHELNSRVGTNISTLYAFLNVVK